MTDEFVTRGLKNDRYLKALRLVDQFEDEIEAILRQFDQRMVDKQPDLFDSDADPDIRTKRSSNSVLAYHRINHPMTGPRAPESDQKLNVHLYWMPPTEYARNDINGALRAFGYKVKNADQKRDERVVDQTRADDRAVDISGNPYDSNTVFYKHVSSTEEIEGTIETLVDHFLTYGDAYAVGSDE